MQPCDTLYTQWKTSTQTLSLHNSTRENVLEILQLKSLSFVSCIHLGGPSTYFFETCLNFQATLLRNEALSSCVVHFSVQHELYPVVQLWPWVKTSTTFLPAGCARSARLAGPKIVLRFPHRLVYIYIFICASTLITCTIITSCTLLPCDLAWVDFGNLDASTDALGSY